MTHIVKILYKKILLFIGKIHLALVSHTDVRVVATTHPWPGARGGCASNEEVVPNTSIVIPPTVAGAVL